MKTIVYVYTVIENFPENTLDENQKNSPIFENKNAQITLEKSFEFWTSAILANFGAKIQIYRNTFIMARLIRKTEEKCCRFGEIREITKEHLTLTSFFIGQVFRTFDDYTFVIRNVSKRERYESFILSNAS